MLILIHEFISLNQELLDVDRLRHISSDYPDAKGEIVAAACARIARIQLPLDSIKNHLDAVFGCIADQDREFISSKSCEDVALAERVPKHVRSIYEGVVSFLVAERIVDLLHAVEIDEADKKRLSCSVSLLRLMFCERDESPPVIKSG